MDKSTFIIVTIIAVIAILMAIVLVVSFGNSSSDLDDLQLDMNSSDLSLNDSVNVENNVSDSSSSGDSDSGSSSSSGDSDSGSSSSSGDSDSGSSSSGKMTQNQQGSMPEGYYQNDEGVWVPSE